MGTSYERLSGFHVVEPGRGGAIKRAILDFDAEVYSYFDADLATDLKHVREALDIVRAGEVPIVVGNRLTQQDTTTRYNRFFIFKHDRELSEILDISVHISVFRGCKDPIRLKFFYVRTNLLAGFSDGEIYPFPVFFSIIVVHKCWVQAGNVIGF